MYAKKVALVLILLLYDKGWLFCYNEDAMTISYEILLGVP